ncbi:hypothetical protein M0805_008948 [Coniferiporia weirii]|nr:hypothetical protein M0805_008948 [Coniferiporia weirii]
MLEQRRHNARSISPRKHDHPSRPDGEMGGFPNGDGDNGTSAITSGSVLTNGPATGTPEAGASATPTEAPISSPSAIISATSATSLTDTPGISTTPVTSSTDASETIPTTSSLAPVSNGTPAPAVVKLETTSDGYTSATTPMGSSSSMAPSSTTPQPLTVQSSPEVSAPSSPDSSHPVSQLNAKGRHTDKGAIAGGVIGGLAFLLLLALAVVFFLRRRRRNRTPASAEFRDYAGRKGQLLGSYTAARQDSSELLDDPPPFTHGDYSDPLFEKLHQTRQAHANYGVAV